MKILENGSGDVTEVMPILTSVLLNSSKKASLRVEEKGAKRLGIITVEDIPITRTLSVLKSLKISGSDVNRVHNTLSKLVSQGSAPQIPAAGTRFLAGDVPIHEIRIQGNQKISDAQIQQTLENSSEDIEQALKTLYKAMPYFEAVNLQINEENSKYIATITVDEKPLSHTYLGLNPPLRLGFNRVTGWEIGTGFELGKRKDIGPLWAWSVRNSTTDQNSKFFGKASYAFGNPHIHYRMGGTANWGKPYIYGISDSQRKFTASQMRLLLRCFRTTMRMNLLFSVLLGYPTFKITICDKGLSSPCDGHRLCRPTRSNWRWLQNPMRVCRKARIGLSPIGDRTSGSGKIHL